MLTASMIVIGEEILSGHVADTNSGHLAGELREVGVPLTRVHTIGDTLEEIDEALQQEIARGTPRLIVTSGGIGSTPDDLTFEAVAASLGRGVVEHPVLSERIGMALTWTGSHGIDVTDEFAWHMLRMARIPEGAVLIDADGSWAPGVQIDIDGGCTDGGITICVLPGVPSQFAAITANAIVPMVSGINPVPTVLEVTHTLPESALNLCFVDLMVKFPDVKLGSYPGTPMLVRLSGPDGQTRGAAEFVTQHLADLLATPGGASLQAAWSARFQAMEDRAEVEAQNRRSQPEEETS